MVCNKQISMLNNVGWKKTKLEEVEWGYTPAPESKEADSCTSLLLHPRLFGVLPDACTQRQQSQK